MTSCVSKVISNLIVMHVLLVSSGVTEGSFLECIPVLTVPRYTVWRAAPMSTLKINCNVSIPSHCWENLALSWCKVDEGNDCKPLNHSSHITTEWRKITGEYKTSFLVFRNLSTADSGLYRCKVDGRLSTISHNINVTVTGSFLECIPVLTVPRYTVWRAAPMSTLKINCTVSIPSHCWENLALSWCKVDEGNDCKPLNHSSHSTTEWRNITGEYKTSFLVFRNLSTADSGLYRCKVDGRVSTISHNINVTVTGSFLECIPVLTVPRYTVWRAAPMSTLKINCTVSIPSHCWENLALSWCKVDEGNDCKPLNHSSHSTTEWRNITGEYKTSFLVFRNLSTADSGLYRCKVDGRVSTISHNINVTVTGSFLECIPVLTVPRYTVWRAAPMSTLKINCTVSIPSHCWENLALSWCKVDEGNDCKPLNHSSHSTTEWRNITGEYKTSFLVFRNLSTADSGLYRCKVDGRVSTISHNINVTVTGSFLECIPVLTVPRYTVWRAAPMSTLKINCTVSIPSHCWENLALSWCKVDEENDCKPLNHSSHSTTEWRNITGEYKTSFLVFRNLSTADSGLYRCKVDGRVSTISHNINVTVTGSFLECIPVLTVPRYTVWRAAPMSTLKINCTVSIPSHCWENLALSWCKVDEGNDCKPLNHSSHSTTEWRNITGEYKTSFLVFRNLSTADSGLYRCKVDGRVSTISHNINVTVTGSFLECIPVLTVPRYTVWRAAPMSTLKINCTVSIPSHCWENLALSWCKVDEGNDCKPLNHSSHSTTEWRNITGEYKTSFLVFRNLSTADSGLYRCKVDGRVSTISHNINVTVTGSFLECIPVLTVPRYTVWRAAPMSTLKINCTVSIPSHCWENLALSWCKVDEGNDCKPLNHSSHSTTEWRNITGEYKTSFLVFRNLSTADSGLYRCKVDGRVSTISHNINVTVTGSFLECIPVLTVPRYTVWRAAPMSTLKINCTVSIPSHCWENLALSWCKVDEENDCKPLNHSSHSTTEWRNITGEYKTSFLVFRNLSTADSGLYRCKVDGRVSTISHNINVTVTGSFLECIPVLTVPRYTVWRAAPMSTLKINCTVSIPSHCWENLALSWCKVDEGNDCKPLNHSSHSTTEWRNITGEYKTSFLVFRNLSTADSGLYRCKVDGRVSTISHNINVTVTGSFLECIPVLTVPRYTVWRAAPMSTLKINCTVSIPSHCWENLALSWCKVDEGNDCKPLNHSSHSTTEWRNITGEYKTSFLVFRNLSTADSGLYRCKVDGRVSTISHNINVIVTVFKEQSAGKWICVLYSLMTAIILTLAIMVLFHNIKHKNKDSKTSVKVKDVLTTVCYKAAEDSFFKN